MTLSQIISSYRDRKARKRLAELVTQTKASEEINATPRHCRKARAWGLLWRSNNRLDGETAYLIHEHCLPVLFKTRQAARDYANQRFGYIKNTPDLQCEPHGWRFPTAVRVSVSLASFGEA